MSSISEVSFDQIFHGSISKDSMAGTLTAKGDVLCGGLTGDQAGILESIEIAMDSTSSTSAHGGIP